MKEYVLLFADKHPPGVNLTSGSCKNLTESSDLGSVMNATTATNDQDSRDSMPDANQVEGCLFKAPAFIYMKQDLTNKFILHCIEIIEIIRNAMTGQAHVLVEDSVSSGL